MSTPFGCSVCSFTSPSNAEATAHVNASNTNPQLLRCPGVGCGIRFCLDDQTQGDDGHFKNCNAMYKWKAERKKGTNIKLPAVRQHCDISHLRTAVAHVTQGGAAATQPAMPAQTAPPAHPAPAAPPAPPAMAAPPAPFSAPAAAPVAAPATAPPAPAAPPRRPRTKRMAPRNAAQDDGIITGTASEMWAVYTARYGPDSTKWPPMEAFEERDDLFDGFNAMLPYWQPGTSPNATEAAAWEAWRDGRPLPPVETPAQDNTAKEDESGDEDEHQGRTSRVDTPMLDDTAGQVTVENGDDHFVEEMD